MEKAAPTLDSKVDAQEGEDPVKDICTVLSCPAWPDPWTVRNQSFARFIALLTLLS